MPPYLDLTDKKIGRFTVLRASFERSIKDWLLLCDCGTEFIRRQKEITKGLVYECPNCVFRRSEFYIGGKKFGRLNVLDEYKMVEWRDASRPKQKKMHRVWKCKCECGTEKWINQQSITRGLTVSCGCYMRKNNSVYANETLYPIKASISSSVNPSYHIWVTLNQKCYNPRYSQYGNWGAKGYTVCDRWRNCQEELYKWLVENGWTRKMAIYIKDGKKEFSPANCELIPFIEYIKKIRKGTDAEKFGIEYKGQTKTLADWARAYSIPYYRLRSRMNMHDNNLDFCLNNDNFKWESSWSQRKDISSEHIKELYESGHTIKEIQKMTGFSGVRYRLRKMGIKSRPAKKRSSLP